MQVSVETTQGLERKLTVQVPAERVTQEVETRLRDLAKRARIDGFRPGKVPFSVVQKRYGGEIEREVMGDLIQSTFFEAVNKENLKPAGAPSVEPKAIETGQPFEYVATFEVYPEISLADAKSLSVARPVVEVVDSDVEKMIDTLRKQRLSWEVVEREAATGDRVTIDFTGTMDGEEFPGGKGEKLPLELGSNAMIPGFEDQLVGATAGGDRQVDVTFPDDYHAKDLAGKKASFAVKIHEVAASRLPELNEEFFRGFGLEDPTEENFRKEVRKSMEREVERRIKGVTKERLMDALLGANSFDTPASLVDEEIDRLMAQMTQQMGGKAPQNFNLPRNLFEDQAKRRVSLGLLMAEVIRSNGIKVDADRVRKTIEDFAADYEKPEEVVSWYYNQREQLQAVESSVLEDQVVDFLLEQAKVTDESIGYDDLMKPESGAGRKE